MSEQINPTMTGMKQTVVINADVSNKKAMYWTSYTSFATATERYNGLNSQWIVQTEDDGTATITSKAAPQRNVVVERGSLRTEKRAPAKLRIVRLDGDFGETPAVLSNDAVSKQTQSAMERWLLLEAESGVPLTLYDQSVLMIRYLNSDADQADESTTNQSANQLDGTSDRPGGRSTSSTEQTETDTASCVCDSPVGSESVTVSTPENEDDVVVLDEDHPQGEDGVCPHQHPLRKAMRPYRAVCDDCNHVVGILGTTWSCGKRRCDYDRCLRCEQRRKEGAKTPSTTEHDDDASDSASDAVLSLSSAASDSESHSESSCKSDSNSDSNSDSESDDATAEFTYRGKNSTTKLVIPQEYAKLTKVMLEAFIEAFVDA